MRAIVVGGGIGGLTAAIALRQVGVEAVVFERAAEMREVGAGIGLWANAMKALRELGLYDAVRAVGMPALDGEVRSWRGEPISKIPAAAMEELGIDLVLLHRADLQKALLAALGEDTVRLGAEFTSFEQDGAGGVVVCFANGQEERGNLLIGADGLRSTVRAQLLGDGPPRYAGYTAWRGVAELENGSVPGGARFESWGRGERFGLWTLGRGRFYWYATKNAPERNEDAAGRKKELLMRFGGWHKPVPVAIRATEEPKILRHDIYDREPVKRWGKGRATLLGDAAHPMTPDLGQGACQAIEDAVVLARCLKEESDVASALRLYEARRADRTAYLVRLSRRLSQVGQLESPLACWLRDTALKAIPQRMQLRQLEAIAGYET